MAQTVAQLAVDSLIENGIDTLCCVPDVQNDHFFNALSDRQNGLRPIQARHEQSAAYMALGGGIGNGKNCKRSRWHAGRIAYRTEQGDRQFGAELD